MDPNETLRQLIASIKEIDTMRGKCEDEEVVFLLDDIQRQFDALHEWLSKGGFLPAMWTKNRQQDGYDKIVIVEE